MNKKVIIGLIIIIIILIIGIEEFIFYQAQDVTTENSVEENVIGNNVQYDRSIQNIAVDSSIKLGGKVYVNI